MSGKIQLRLAVLGALAALVAVLVPAGLASGSHAGDLVTGNPSVVLLRMGAQDRVTWTGNTSLVQTISTKKNDCLAVTFAASPELLKPTADGGELGEVKDGFGVQGAGDGAGEPCGRVEADGEAITMSLGSHFGAGYVMTAVDLDLELKFGATVTVEYRHGDTVVATDSFNPMEGADDGPDSADGDNYRYVHRPQTDAGDQIHFDSVKLIAGVGAFSLEGGADGTENGSLVATSNASQFEIQQVFDGDISCGETFDIEDGGVGIVALRSLNLDPDNPVWDPQCTARKPFIDALDTEGTPSLLFKPDSAAQGRYTLGVTLTDQAITVDGDGVITSLKAVYDETGSLAFPDSTTDPLPACEGQPVLEDDPATTEVNEYDDFWSQADVGLLPTGETACFYHASVEPTAAGKGTERWGIYFEDDPSMRF